MVEANIQMRALKTEVEKGFMFIFFFSNNELCCKRINWKDQR